MYKYQKKLSKHLKKLEVNSYVMKSKKCIFIFKMDVINIMTRLRFVRHIAIEGKKLILSFRKMLINFLIIFYKLWRLCYRRVGKVKFLINYFMGKLFQRLYVRNVKIKFLTSKNFHVWRWKLKIWRIWKKVWINLQNLNKFKDIFVVIVKEKLIK